MLGKIHFNFFLSQNRRGWIQHFLPERAFQRPTQEPHFTNNFPGGTLPHNTSLQYRGAYRLHEGITRQNCVRTKPFAGKTTIEAFCVSLFKFFPLVFFNVMKLATMVKLEYTLACSINTKIDHDVSRFTAGNFNKLWT